MKQLFTLSCLALSVLVVCFANPLQAQSSKTSAIQFASDKQVLIYESAVDTGNRIISVGDFTDSAYIQGTKQGFSGKDSTDGLVVCTDEQGNIIWKDIFGVPNKTWATNVVCDKLGNCFVSGYFETGFTIDGVTFTGSSNNNAFLMKLDYNGKAVWGISYAVPTEYALDIAPTLACDADGNLYYALSLFSPLKISGQLFDNAGGQGALIAKFDKDGNLVWGKTMLIQNAAFLQFINSAALTTDLFGHVYIGGYASHGKITWGGSDLSGITDTVSVGLFFARIDAATGNMQWIQRCSGISPSELTYLNISGNGSLYAAGYFGDTLKIQGQSYYANGSDDGLVMNFDTSGKVKWLQHYGNPIEPEYPAGFCMDHSDYVYIGGTFDAPITLGNKTLFSTKARDVYVIRFDRGGNYVSSISSKAISTSSFTSMEGLMVDSHNKLLVLGSLNSQTNFGGDTLSCFGPTSSFIWEVVSSFSGIEPELQESVNGFTLYPNPVNGNILNLQLSNNTSKGNMEISCLDETGRLIFSQVLQPSEGVNNSYSLSLPALKSGLYFVRLVSENGISVQKFIKN